MSRPASSASRQAKAREAHPRHAGLREQLGEVLDEAAHRVVVVPLGFTSLCVVQSIHECLKELYPRCMSDATSISGLVKTFGHDRALDGLDLSVATGEVHGFLGPNGAGKSTTIRVLLGLLRADAGQVACSAATRGATRSRCTAGSPTSPATSTCGPTCPAARRSTCSAGCAAGSTRPAAPTCSSASSSTPPRRRRTYSKGNRQKVALVAALASDVELLVLDEPTSGLDPLMEAVFRECIGEARGRGPHRAAVEPHPGRGRGAVRPRQHHPRRPHGGERHARRAAPPDADLDRRRDRPGPRRAGDAARRPRPARRGPPRPLRRRHGRRSTRRCTTCCASASAA